MLSGDFRRLLAVALVITTTFITLPVSAADFSSARPVIGSVGAVGTVDLRGVGVAREGTLFSGDTIRAHEKGYAKVLLGTGDKIELFEKTEVIFNRDAQGVKIAMNTGTLGFTAMSPLRVDLAPFEVTATDASGNVAITSSGTAGVKAINGKVTVRNLKTSESFVLTEGQQQLLLLQKGTHLAPIAQVASNVPPTVPGGKPQTPAGKTSGSGLQMDTGAWLAVIAGAGVLAVAIAALVEASNNNSDINGLKSQVATLNGNITSLQNTINTNQASTAATLHTIQNAVTLSANLAAQQAALNQLLSNETQALAALQASGLGNSTQAKNLQTAIAQAQAALAAVSSAQGSAAACTANPASCSTSQLQSTNSSTQSGTNTAINNGNSAVNNSGTGNTSNVGNVNGSTISASVPV